MLQKYLDLYKHALLWGFRKDVYTTWWSVPIKQRLKFGITVGVNVFVVLQIMSAAQASRLVWLLVMLFFILVMIPVYQFEVETIIKKHAKNNSIKEL